MGRIMERFEIPHLYFLGKIRFKISGKRNAASGVRALDPQTIQTELSLFGIT